MPGYKGHLAGGTFAFVALLYSLSFANPTTATALEWLLCSLAGSLFPDIDVKSKGQNYFYKFLLIVVGLLLAQGHIHLCVFLSVLAMVPMVVRHRGIFHRLWFILLLPCATAWCISSYYPQYTYILLFDVAFFSAGAVSHLWLDVGLRKMLRF